MQKKVHRNKPQCTDVTWAGRADCAQCAIRSRVLFADVSNEELEHILLTIDDMAYAPHSVLYQAGEKGDSMFTIRRGLVKLVQYLPNGAQRIVRLLKTGDVAGLELAVGRTYKHAAIALNETHVCRIPKSAIEHMGADNPLLCHQFMVRWQRNIDEADRTITEFSTGPADVRIARLLLHLALPGEDGHCQVMGREDMGSILGITTETASRVMADFKRRGLLLESSNLHSCHCNKTLLRQVADS